MAFLAAGAASASTATSSFTASRLGRSPRASRTVCGLRAVATTESPRSRAARAMSTPNPREAPVMNHTLLPDLTAMTVLLGDRRRWRRLCLHNYKLNVQFVNMSVLHRHLRWDSHSLRSTQAAHARAPPLLAGLLLR